MINRDGDGSNKQTHAIKFSKSVDLPHCAGVLTIILHVLARSLAYIVGSSKYGEGSKVKSLFVCGIIRLLHAHSAALI